MRSLLLLGLAAAVAVPAVAQVHVRALPNVGYDAGYHAPSVGFGVEVGWTAPALPVSIALRPSADLVFAESLPLATPYMADGVADRGTSNVARVGAEIVSRWERAPLPVVPYLKAGIVGEYERYESGDLVLAYWEADAVAGAGVSLGRAFVEGTLGFGDASRSRLAVGVRL